MYVGWSRRYVESCFLHSLDLVLIPWVVISDLNISFSLKASVSVDDLKFRLGLSCGFALGLGLKSTARSEVVRVLQMSHGEMVSIVP